VIKSERGSMIVLASFVFLAITLLCVSYWQLIRVKTTMVFLKEKQFQAYLAARSGVEDAIFELRQGHTWDTGGGLSSQWTHLDGSTFYKTSGLLPANNLTHFDYPVTISVTVEGDPSVGTLNVVSESQVGLGRVGLEKKDKLERAYTSHLQADVIRSLRGEFFIVNMKEL
jgi:hypothetical protein